jgi:DNA-binding NarL/FixJ family response regulator
MKYRIAIVDDSRQQLQSLKEKINYAGEFEVLFTASNGKEYLEQLKMMHRDALPQVVLMDIDMPVMNGIETVRNATAAHDNIAYIMLTVFDDDEQLFSAIQAGASGYMLKEEGISTLIKSIKEVADKEGAPMSPSIARKALKLLSNAHIPQVNDAKSETTLSQREMEILTCLVNGLDFRQISAELFISPNTARKHIANIYTKLHVTSKVQAVKLALKNKWV